MIAERLRNRAETCERQLIDRTRPANVLFCESNGSYAQLPPLMASALACWLYETPAAVSGEQLEQQLAAQELRRCDDVLCAVVALDHDVVDPDSERALVQVLDDGLRRREGSSLLGGAATVYLHLIARNFRPSRLRVCERCQVVHEAKRARRCKRCRHSPPRPKPRLWHDVILIPGPANTPRATVLTIDNVMLVTKASDRRGRPARMTYVGRCACGQRFESTNAQTRYCADCATGAARTERSRKKHAGGNH